TCGLVIGAYCPPEPPTSGYALRLPLVVAPPLTQPPKGLCPFATWQGCRWPLRFASLYLPPCLRVGSLQRHQVLSRHKPLRFASLYIQRSLDPFSLFLSGIGVKGASGSRS